MRRTLPLLLVGLLVSGCAACTTEVVFAVDVVVQEASGPTADPVSIRYRVDGGEWTVIPDTQGIVMTGDICLGREECLIGPEISGEYEIEVTRGPDMATAMSSVGEDDCHVMGTRVVVTLP